MVRDLAKLSDSVGDRVDVVSGSHGDADVVDRAFAGVPTRRPPHAPVLHEARQDLLDAEVVAGQLRRIDPQLVAGRPYRVLATRR